MFKSKHILSGLLAVYRATPKVAMSALDGGFLPDLARPFVFRLTRIWTLAYLTGVVAAVGVAVIVSSTDSSLPFAEQIHLVSDDLREAWGFHAISAASLSISSWPAWRDVFTLTVILSMASTPALASIQWDGYRRLIEHMRSRGSLRFVGPGADARVRRELRETNEWIYRIRFARIPILLVCVTVAALIFRAQLSSHFLPGRAVEYGRQVQSASNWWIGNNEWLSIVYFAVGVTGLYIVTVQNIVGCRIILAVVRLRAELSFGADYLNEDKSWGWLPAKRILGATYAEIVVHGFGLLAILLAMPHVGLAYVVAAIPAVEWMLTLPIYIGVPTAVIIGNLRAFRARERNALQAPSSDRSSLTTYPVQLAERFVRFNQIPVIPFMGTPEKTLFVVAQIANFGACYGLIVALVYGKGNA